MSFKKKVHGRNETSEVSEIKSQLSTL